MKFARDSWRKLSITVAALLSGLFIVVRGVRERGADPAMAQPRCLGPLSCCSHLNSLTVMTAEGRTPCSAMFRLVPRGEEQFIRRLYIRAWTSVVAGCPGNRRLSGVP